MAALPLDNPQLRGDARTRETVLRLALTGTGDGTALFSVIEEWLRRKARFLGISLATDLGRHGERSERGHIEIERASDRLVVSLTEVDSNTPSRYWTTEIDAGIDDRLDVRVTVEQARDSPYAPRQTPLFVANAVADTRVAFADVLPLGTVPRAVAADEIDDLITLVDEEARQLPVVAVSVPTAIDPVVLARRLAGAAHVVTLDSDASFALTERVGRHRSIFHGGVRTYPAGFRWTEPPRQAPLWLGVRLLEDSEDLPALERIVRLVLARTARGLASRALLAIADVDRQARLKREPLASALHDDVLNLERDLEKIRAERDALQADLDERTMFWQEIEADNARLLEERNDAEDAAQTARGAELRWRSALEESRKPDTGDQLVLDEAALAPKDSELFANFVQTRYRGHILVSKRARRFYAKGEFEDREFLVRVLDAIAVEYYGMARGVVGAHERWDAACERLRLKYGLSSTPTGVTEDHILRWGGQDRTMYHVRSLGKTYDPRRMLYVGFIFDESAQQVVLGRLPSKPATMADHT